MASSSSSSSTAALGHPVSEKLIGDNFLIGQNFLVLRAQALPAMRGAQLTSYLDGTKEVPHPQIEIVKKVDDKEVKEVIDNLAYSQWVA
ncbi:hypothetical protein E2562_019935 [Oryza meyeriana var. granulata]|uniref:Uncharacterized protein n=1 Tax=Oryza meyeriana var. granulata TaxID=110450 RepID=A0A6G1EMZ1_9ORYZ|nr:hypothetical protein E2562_019935 [Oryza meyeriana var. granulata]